MKNGRWETTYTRQAPILDPSLPLENQPTLRGLALPDVVRQKIHHDNTVRLMTKVGISLA